MIKRFCDDCGKKITTRGANARYQTDKRAYYFRARRITTDVEPDLCDDCLNDAIAEMLDLRRGVEPREEPVAHD